MVLGLIRALTRCLRSHHAKTLVLALMLSACGGGGGGSGGGVGTGGSSGNTTVDTSRTGQAYWTNFNGNQVSSFLLGDDGLKSSGPVVADTGAGGPVALALSPNGAFLYVARYVANKISAYTRNTSTGALTLIDANMATGNSPFALSVDRSGKFLFVANSAGRSISSYAIANGTGSLTAIATTTTPDDPLSVAASPNKDLLYVTLRDNTIRVFGIHPFTGILTQLQPLNTREEPLDLHLSADGKLAFVVNATAGNVISYLIDAGNGYLTLADIAMSDGGNGSRPVASVALNNGSKLYVINETSMNISVFNVNTSTGALNPMNTPAGKNVATTQNYPSSIAINAAQDRLYVTNAQSNTLSVYSIDPTNGWPELLGTYATGEVPRSVKVVR